MSGFGARRASTARSRPRRARPATSPARSNLAELTREELDRRHRPPARPARRGDRHDRGHDEALEVAHAQATGMPFVVVEGDLTRAPLDRRRRPVAGASCHPAPDRPRAHRDRARHRPADWTEARARLTGWRSRDARRRPAAAAAARGRLDRRAAATRPAASSPRRATSRRSSWPTTRWPSACCAPCRGRARGARRRQRRRLRRHPRGGVPIPPLTTVRQDFQPSASAPSRCSAPRSPARPPATPSRAHRPRAESSAPAPRAPPVEK